MADADNAQDQDPSEQPLISHLIELRDRILRCLLVVMVLFLCLFPFGNDIFEFVSEPLRAALPEGGQLIATAVTTPFMTPFKLSFFAALCISIPFILHQAWAFIAPGLYRNEIKVTLPILVSSVMLFYLGILFAYYIVFGYIFAFFAGSAPASVEVMTDISLYLDFVMALFLVFGIIFEIPIATLLLIFSGVTTAKSLAAKRPYIIISCFVVGMMLTPSDPFSQSFVAIPMWMLFEVGILAGRILHKPDPEDEEETEATES